MAPCSRKAKKWQKIIESVYFRILIKFYLNSNKHQYIFQYNGEILNISILAGTGCQQTWQGHTGKEQKYFVCLKLSILSYQILKYPILVHTNMKFKCLSQFQGPGMILQVLIPQKSLNSSWDRNFWPIDFKF